jgi:hypothetical protein
MRSAASAVALRSAYVFVAVVCRGLSVTYGDLETSLR